jgi:hypothetical protein
VFVHHKAWSAKEVASVVGIDEVANAETLLRSSRGIVGFMVVDIIRVD